jgi:hypothetical protein
MDSETPLSAISEPYLFFKSVASMATELVVEGMETTEYF